MKSYKTEISLNNEQKAQFLKTIGTCRYVYNLFIEVRQVDRFYPSSKKCSRCGNIKKDLNLSDRIYKCDCGLIIDRDWNAAINLKQVTDYKIA